MNSKELVKRAVEFKSPGKLPLLYFNKYTERSDIKFVEYNVASDFKYKGTAISEWGFVWETFDDTMGQPKDEPIKSWDDFKGYIPPDPDAPGRYDHIEQEIKANFDKYIMGVLGITGFNIVTFIRGFENSMEDLYLERENIEELIDMVISFENGIIRNYAKFGIDAVSFGDDWGTQNSLMISPQLWREVFKPRFKAQFDLVHQHGMHVYFHSCGYIYDIIPDLIEIGVDIFNLNQPDLLGIENLGRDFGGKVCFNCPVDHQTVAISGNRKEIFDYVAKLNKCLGCFNGGLIGNIEEYHSVGMSTENFNNIIEAFESYRNR
jgi:uroporphyrinogen decarboxylase